MFVPLQRWRRVDLVDISCKSCNAWSTDFVIRPKLHHFDLLVRPCPKKPGMHYYVTQLSQMWTNVNNSFTVAFSDEVQIKMV